MKNEQAEALGWLLSFVGQGSIDDFAKYVNEHSPVKTDHAELVTLIDKCVGQCWSSLAIKQAGERAKRFYYYAEPEKFFPFDKEQDIRPTSLLTQAMVLKIIDNHATGLMPFELRTPSQIVFNICDWPRLEKLFKVRLIENRKDHEPYDTAFMTFETCEVVILARRQDICVFPFKCT